MNKNPLSGYQTVRPEASPNQNMKPSTQTVTGLAQSIDQHRIKIDSEIPLIEEASSMIRGFTYEKLRELTPLLVNTCNPDDDEYEIIHEAIQEIDLFIDETSTRAGYVWAYENPGNELLSVIMDAWFAAESDTHDLSTEIDILCENRWPGIRLNWFAFLRGACDAFDDALEQMIQDEE